MGSPVDLNMAFTQPASPAASPAPTLAAVSTLTPAHVLGAPYGAMPLSGLLGVKSVPFLTLSSPAPAVAVTAAPSHTTLAAYTAKISSANCIKKPERQKFAPYWWSLWAPCAESDEGQLQCSFTNPWCSHIRWQRCSCLLFYDTPTETRPMEMWIKLLKVIYDYR